MVLLEDPLLWSDGVVFWLECMAMMGPGLCVSLIPLVPHPAQPQGREAPSLPTGEAPSLQQGPRLPFSLQSIHNGSAVGSACTATAPSRSLAHSTAVAAKMASVSAPLPQVINEGGGRGQGASSSGLVRSSSTTNTNANANANANANSMSSGPPSLTGGGVSTSASREMGILVLEPLTKRSLQHLDRLNLNIYSNSRTRMFLAHILRWSVYSRSLPMHNLSLLCGAMWNGVFLVVLSLRVLWHPEFRWLFLVFSTALLFFLFGVHILSAFSLLLSICVSCLPLCPSVRPSVCHSLRLPICLSVCLSAPLLLPTPEHLHMNIHVYLPF